MDFQIQATLAHTTAISIIATAWYHERILILIQDHLSDPCFEQIWSNVEDKVLANLTALPVPVSIRKYFLDFAQPMGKEIVKWMEVHKFLKLNKKITTEVLSWNTLGLIDRKRTAKNILTNSIPDRFLFRLACMHGFEDDIIRIWPQIRNTVDISFPQICNMDPTVMFWICYLEHNVDTLMRAVDYIGYRDNMHFAFWLSIGGNNEIAAEFYLSKLPVGERQRLANMTARKLCENNGTFNFPMLPFLLLYLEHPLQEELLCIHPQPILLQFLNWHRRSIFMDIAKRTWTYLLASDFYRVLDEIAHYVSEFHRSEVYLNIFKDFWQNSPRHCRDYVRIMCVDGTYLIRLSLIRYTDYIIRTIIRSFTQYQKKRMISSNNGLQFLASLMKKQRWNTIQMVFEECVTPLEDTIWINNLIEIYKDAFERSTIFIATLATEKKTFLEMLNSLRNLH